LRPYSKSSPHCSSVYKLPRASDETTMMASTMTAAGGAHDRDVAQPLEVVGPPASASGRQSLTTATHRGIQGIVHLLLQVFYFFQSLIGIVSPCHTSTPPIDEVAVACPPSRNNNDVHGRAIYIGVIVDPGGGTTHACLSSSCKLMV
jgi:hypothetical protein